MSEWMPEGPLAQKIMRARTQLRAQHEVERERLEQQIGEWRQACTHCLDCGAIV